MALNKIKPAARFPRLKRYLLISLAVALSLFVLAALLFVAFLRGSDGCSFFPGDQNRPIKEAVIDSTTYYLHLRISGFHDKVVYFAVYDQKPSFGCHGSPEQKSIGWAHYDEIDPGASIVQINLPDNKMLEIQFTNNYNLSTFISELNSIAYHGGSTLEFGSENIEVTIREGQIEIPPLPEILEESPPEQ